MTIWMIRPPPCSSISLQMVICKRMVLRTTKIKGTEEHGLLQMIIRMIRPPPCSSVPLQMVICKEDGSQDDLNHGNGGARILANDHPDDRASSVLLRSSVSAIFQNCNEMIPVGKALNTFNSHYMNKINNANKLGPK